MALAPPQYGGHLPSFVGDLRSRLFSTQKEAAEHVNVKRPTITRYENGTYRPPLGYLAHLIRLLVDKQEEVDVADTYRSVLMKEANRAIRDYYQDEIFQSWDELRAVADAYMAEQQAKDQETNGPEAYTDERKRRFREERGQEADQHTETHPFPQPHRSNIAKPSFYWRGRQKILSLVEEFWIKGVLESSLHYAIMLELDIVEHREAVDHPWDVIVQTPHLPNRLLPPGVKIIDIFDELGDTLLILGDPGAGKTTMLLELARDAIKYAKSDLSYPLPVVFNLSSWSKPTQTLTDWLIDELNFKYSIPRKIGNSWIENNELLLLLDGLDEVAQERRDRCIDTINSFYREHVMPIVVCSRTADYDVLSKRLKFHNAVVIQPLTPQQIDVYLNKIGPELTSVRRIMQYDTTLQRIVQSPLMLSIMTLAYRGVSVDNLPSFTSVKAQYQHLFEAYIEQMFKRRTPDHPYLPKQTVYWLSWLAQKMLHHAQSVFFIEQMQPTWLETNTQRRLYSAGVGLSISLVFGLVFGLLGSRYGSSGFSIGTGAGFILWLIYLALGELNIKWLSDEIKPVKVLHWSPQGIKRVVKLGLGVGLSTGLMSGFIGGLIIELVFGLALGLIVGLLSGLSVGMYFGLSRIEIETRTISDKGIIESIKNAAVVGLIFGLTAGLLLELTISLIVGLPIRLVEGAVNGLTFGFVVSIGVGLLFGGSAFIQHSILRFVLYESGYIPFNYVRFLDYATERIFLRKVGRGYIFIHRLLLEYFAALELDQDN